MEQEPRHNNPENSDETAKDDSESSKKKKKRAKDLAELLSKKAESDEAKPESQDKEAEPSTWQKLLGETNADKDSEEQSEADDEAAQKEIIDQLESSGDAPELEDLSPAEQAAVAKAYIESRLAELDTEAAEPENKTEHSTLEDFLQNLRARINRSGGGEDIEQDIEESFAESVGAMPEPGAPMPPPPSHHNQHYDFLPDRPVPIAPHRPDVRQAFESPKSTAEEFISHDESMTREAQAQAKGVVAGLLFGYLIGRRRGRIKTEKRLQKVQTELEKQVKNVQSQIVGKELQIKKLTKGSRETGARLQAAEERINRPERIVEDKKQNMPPPPPVNKLAREERPAHSQSFAEQKPVSRETFVPTANEQNRFGKSPEARPAYHHNAASRQEIIEKSSQIKIGESDLRKVWEARLIDETGLRRIVAEAEAGGDVRRALASEFLARELRFERDPYLKNTSTSPEQKAAGQAGRADVMQGRASQDSNLGAGANAPGSQAARNHSNGHASRQPVKVSPLLLTGLTILTIALAIWAIYLMITA